MGLFRLRKCRLGACATCRHCVRRFNLWYYCALGYGFFGHLADHDGCDHFDYFLQNPANSHADAATPDASDKNADCAMLDEDNIEETDFEFEVDFIEEGSDDAEDLDDDGYMDDDDFGDEAYDDDYRDDFFDQERYDEDYYYYGNDGGEYD